MSNDKVQILIADDNADLTDLLCEYIGLFSSDIIEVLGVAHNGYESIQMITALKPDIVILDIIMPYLNGIEVLEKIQKCDIAKKPLFIVLSAAGQNSIVKEALSLDASVFLEKPFDMDILISKIIQLKSLITSYKTVTSSGG
jgi:two-component system, response regulator, stage 0 sporulation protein A